jgi:hypothetical protein
LGLAILQSALQMRSVVRICAPHTCRRGRAGAVFSGRNDEALACQEGRLPRERLALDLWRHRLFELLDPLECGRDLGLDDRVDERRTVVERVGQLRLRPFEPAWVGREQVKEHV